MLRLHAEPAGANCPYGGTRIDAGLNADGSTTWSGSTTVTATNYVCNASAAWVTATGTTQQAASNTGYVASNAASVAITLPASPAIGDTVSISGAGAGGWSVTPNTGQSIVTSNVSTITMPDTAAQAPITGPQYSAIVLQYIGSDRYIVLSYIGSIGNNYVTQGGLTWSPANVGLFWGDANTYCAGTVNGSTGWRLPTQAELVAMSASNVWRGHGWGGRYTWTSTPGGAGHWGVVVDGGSTYTFSNSYHADVTCVK